MAQFDPSGWSFEIPSKAFFTLDISSSSSSLSESESDGSLSLSLSSFLGGLAGGVFGVAGGGLGELAGFLSLVGLFDPGLGERDVGCEGGGDDAAANVGCGGGDDDEAAAFAAFSS